MPRLAIASSAAPLTRDARADLLVVVNAHASGVDHAGRTAGRLATVARSLGQGAMGVVTRTETQLWVALQAAVTTRRRVVLVGGDGSLHCAANAPLTRLPELALVPAGRANNVARALGIPTDPVEAMAVAAGSPARALDALRVQTPTRRLYAIEAVSAGFHAEARSGYDADNSSDLRQGCRALVRALRSYAPYRIDARVDGRELSSTTAAQLFVANLPYFGFGFRIDPCADGADGRLAAIMIEARSRGALLRRLAASFHGRHLQGPGTRRLAGRRVELRTAVPLVADAVPLGTTTAVVSVHPARLSVATPSGEERA